MVQAMSMIILEIILEEDMKNGDFTEMDVRVQDVIGRDNTCRIYVVGWRKGLVCR